MAAAATNEKPTNPLLVDDPVRAAAERAGVDPQVARALLREQYESIDPLVPQILQAVRERGGAECWHKHSSFLAHLTGTWAISVLWGLPREVQLCALLHSAFSNSFVNLALFAPNDEGKRAVRELAGEEVEKWTWLFCRVPRNELVYDRLVDPICYRSGGGGGGDDDANSNNASSSSSSPSAPPDYSSQFPESITVSDIRDGSPIILDPYQIGTLVALTILDFSEQWHAWQDGMFATLEDEGGRMRYSGKRAHHLWPGPSKPGLYLHTLSEMGRLVVAANAKLEATGDPRRVPLPKPWWSCSYVVSREAQLKGRDLYWRAVTELFDAGAAEFQLAADKEEEKRGGDDDDDAAAAVEALRLKGEEREREAEKVLRECSDLLPCVGEPRVVLAQLLLQRAVRWQKEKGDTAADACWREAGELALEGLSLLLSWGTPWDKRFPIGAWCAWARVCCEASREKKWPGNDEPLRVINLGLVR